MNDCGNCYHDKAAHPSKAWIDGGVPTPCRATIFVYPNLGPRTVSYTFPCPCSHFKEHLSSPVESLPSESPASLNEGVGE